MCWCLILYGHNNFLSGGLIYKSYTKYAQEDRDLILFTSFELHVFSSTSRYRHFCPGRVYSPWAFYVITQCLFILKKNKTEKDYNSSCRGHNIVIRIRHSHKSSFYWKGRKKRRRTDKTTNHAIGSTRNDPIQTHFHRTTLMNIYSLEWVILLIWKIVSVFFIRSICFNSKCMNLIRLPPPLPQPTSLYRSILNK